MAFLIVLAMAGFALAEGAGTILLAPTKDQDGNIRYLVLIADHKDSDRGYATMGGGIEEGEDPRDAAARETEQESRGKYRREAIRQKIEHARAIKKGNFTVYVVVVEDLIPEEELEAASMDCEDCGERYGYKWIPLPELDEVVKTNGYTLPKDQRSKHSETDHLWGEFVNAYIVAKSEIAKEVKKDRSRRSKSPMIE